MVTEPCNCAFTGQPTQTSDVPMTEKSLSHSTNFSDTAIRRIRVTCRALTWEQDSWASKRRGRMKLPAATLAVVPRRPMSR